MNQRDATVALIEFFRGHPSGEMALASDRSLLRAVKTMERRAEVLRLRYELRRATPLADEIVYAEPLAVPHEELLFSFHGTACPVCQRKKYSTRALCIRCDARLEPSLRKTLSIPHRTTFVHAYCMALRILKPRGDANEGG